MIYNGHLGRLDDIAPTVRKCADRLRPHKDKYDVIVATGLSGVLIASPLAIRLRKELVVVRKPKEDCHSLNPVVNSEALVNKRFLFLDDFISLGGTYDRVRTIMNAPWFHTRYAGCYMYNDDVLSWDGDGIIDYRPKNPPDERKTRVDYRLASLGQIDFSKIAFSKKAAA